VAVSNSPMVLVCLLAGFACGPDPFSSGSTSETSETSEGSTSAMATTQPEQTESDTTTTETGTSEAPNTESESDTTTSEPDLPPEPACVPFAEAQRFDELCFGPPVTIDPEPMQLVARTSLNVYASGPDDHRLYELDELEPGGVYESLPLAGTSVHAAMLFHFGAYEDPEAVSPFMIVTREPHALVLVVFDPSPQIHTVFALDAEPTAAAFFVTEPQRISIAVTDIDAHLHVFDLELGVTVLSGTRMLPEPLEYLDANFGWIGDSGTKLLGRSNATLTAWFLTPPISPIMGLGAIEAYPYPAPISDWDIGGFTDAGPPSMLSITQAPSVARLHSALDFQEPGSSVPLAHPVSAITGGEVPGVLGGTFALSMADARVGHLMNHYGEGSELLEPSTWIEVAPDCVSFIAVAGPSFLCASTSEGLVLVSPQ
jgi:hypothetical protein